GLLLLHRGRTDGTFDSPLEIAAWKGSAALLEARDLDGDGHEDVIAAFGNPPSLTVLWGAAPPTLLEEAVVPLAGAEPVAAAAMADLDADGFPDLLVQTRGRGVLAFLGRRPSLAPSFQVPLSRSLDFLEAADLDEDGVPDLAGLKVAGGEALIALLRRDG